MITNIDDYFNKGCGRCDRFDTPDCSALLWREGLEKLRGLCLGVGLEETIKWGQPCYVYEGRTIAIIGAFKNNFCLSFFHAALMKDPENLLEKSGPNTPHKDIFRFTSGADVEKLASKISAYLEEAMHYADKNMLPEKQQIKLNIPQELIDCLEADPILADAFQALTPGRQKSYIINLNNAKQAQTRRNRIAKFREKILAGKGALER